MKDAGLVNFSKELKIWMSPETSTDQAFNGGYFSILKPNLIFFKPKDSGWSALDLYPVRL
jgi:hypothetical protein